MRLETALLHALVLGVCARAACAQSGGQPVGRVAASDGAVITQAGGGVVPVASGRTSLTGSSTVAAAANHSAVIALARGGDVRVCPGSVLHTAEAPAAGGHGIALLLALDRGAVEIKRKGAAGDLLQTPDLRLSTTSAAPLDLRVRVVFEGDTCVENRGRRAPVLEVTDAFGDATYQVKPGQHVTFERGSLRAVLDRETTPCGCPPESGERLSLADAALRARPGAPDQHPFPVAESQGLTPPAPAAPEKPGETHLQVTTALEYDPNAPAPQPAVTGSAAAVVPPATAAAGKPAPAPAPAAASKADRKPRRSVGRFFRGIFGGK